MAPDLLRFDAIVDVTDAFLPRGMRAEDAVARVREAIAAMPGAGWVDVAACAGAPARLPWLTLYRPGSSHPAEGDAWSGVAAAVEAAVRRALS